MNQTLKNKCTLVTGCSRGIGAAIVKRLASEGANVARLIRVHPTEPAIGNG
jgi:3-oxoacyl-[acyl-carrier protein] reductase